ncbi:MAG TPA: hypothetical protein VFH73_24405 [Polyangia bacterium]|nr:hypothetical protein [Polyangia bacterium]
MSDPPAEGPQAGIYQWELPTRIGPARAFRAVVRLRNLAGWPRQWLGLSGRFVTVRNAAVVPEPGPTDVPIPTPIGSAHRDGPRDLIFDPGRGGGRIDKVAIADADVRWRYVQAARFGEVNTYHHTDRIAAYVDELLHEVGGRSLPPVIAIVNAHHAAVVDGRGARDGRLCPDGRWVPFQGGHYRLPGRATRIAEPSAPSPDGEIHLGPGQKLTRRGALADLVGGAYRANASHNPAIIYHEYGHHLCRHTADFRANRSRPRDEQSNVKTALDEGIADYFTAVMLGTPHIWFLHHRDDASNPHRRSLTSPRTMDSFVRGPAADAHANGTIWAAALWQLRSRVAARMPATQTATGGKSVDRLVVKALLLIGDERSAGGDAADRVRSLMAFRRSFRRAGAALLRADALIYGGALRDDIVAVLGARGIRPEASVESMAIAAS